MRKIIRISLLFSILLLSACATYSGHHRYNRYHPPVAGGLLGGTGGVTDYYIQRRHGYGWRNSRKFYDRSGYYESGYRRYKQRRYGHNKSDSRGHKYGKYKHYRRGYRESKHRKYGY